MLYSLLLLLLLISGFFEGSMGVAPCDPLVPEYCGLPYPNSYFTMAAQDTPTGVRLNLSAEIFPPNTLGVPLDPKTWNQFDGFSPFPSILTYFAHLSDSNLPPHWDIGRSLLPSSPTILLHADTGERVAHFAELDSNFDLPLSKRALMIWPSQRLKDSSRYIVALRALETTKGEPVQPSITFKLLRNQIASGDPDVEERRDHFENIFKLLDTAGVERSSLQLAWDFTTASLDCLTKRLVFARDDALVRVKGIMEGGSPPYTIKSITDNYDQHIFRRLQGNMKVPLYLKSPFPGAELVINDDTGLPVFQYITEVQFTVLIPHSVANGTLSPPLLLQYGHGIFGSQDEVETGYLKTQADAHGYILFACDWWGLAQYDLPAILEMLNFFPSHFSIIPDRLTQGMVNAHVLMEIVKSSLSMDSRMTLNSSIKIDPALSHYYGNSLGGIMGEVYMASTTNVIRGVLGVAGGPFALLLPRSTDFQDFEVDVRVLHPDPVAFSLIISFWNLIWSRLDPNAYMSSITGNPLKNTPTHRVLYHYSPGDAQVNIVATYAVARSAGAVMFASNGKCQYAFHNGSGLVNDTLFGFPLVPDDTVVTQESVATAFLCGAPPNPRGNVPPSGATDTHEKPRRSLLAQKQMDGFMRSGEIRNVCNGPCKCS